MNEWIDAVVMNTMNFGPLLDAHITQLQESSSKTRGSKTLVLSAVYMLWKYCSCVHSSLYSSIHPKMSLYAFVSEMIQDTDHLAKQNASLIGAVIYWMTLLSVLFDDF